ncbi:MAG TPA: hypothetical protein VFN80_02005 [Acidothermaceae bacterium]|nr:hypothetical protein [Acidothermaceae bacterium]
MSSQSAVRDSVPRGGEQLFAAGTLFLLVSFFLMLASTTSHNGGTGTAVLLWCENTAFWLGIVLIAGHVLARVVRRPAVESGDRS